MTIEQALEVFNPNHPPPHRDQQIKAYDALNQGIKNMQRDLDLALGKYDVRPGLCDPENSPEDDLINGLHHAADDHPCCKDTLLNAAEAIGQRSQTEFPKIVQILVTPNSITWQSRLLGLGDDGNVYVDSERGWELFIEGKFPSASTEPARCPEDDTASRQELARRLLMHAVYGMLSTCGNSYANAHTEQWLTHAKSLGAYHGEVVGNIKQIEDEWERWIDNNGGLPDLDTISSASTDAGEDQ